MSTKRKKIAYYAKSNVFFNKKRNRKDSLLWTDVDENIKTSDIIRPDREKGGSVLKLGLFNGSSGISTTDFPKQSKLNTHFVGNSTNKVEENDNTSTSGESLCFTIIFITAPFAAPNADLNENVNIIIHESGHSYKVGDEITLDGQQFVTPSTSAFGVPCVAKPLILKVLAVNNPKK